MEFKRNDSTQLHRFTVMIFAVGKQGPAAFCFVFHAIFTLITQLTLQMEIGCSLRWQTAKISTCQAKCGHGHGNVAGDTLGVHPFERNFECPKGIKAGQKLIATTQAQTQQTSNNYIQN